MSTDLVFHWVLPEPPRPQTPLPHSQGRTGKRDRRKARSPLHTPTARAVNAHVLHEGEPCEGDDFPVWRTSFSPDGPFWGELRATPFRRMRGDLGDVEIIPNRYVS